ncbi:hypothetical protein NDU88_006880 [Pleurodeles waltl]|uniref:Uncharacterized protein n=1 Tax=Pleurodeles waltl TaxID=8319 RepID=A0AAV7SQR6_PLEWA|nr:hypothetical protein NDU88_006880 [Pleurodeles waltl]
MHILLTVPGKPYGESVVLVIGRSIFISAALDQHAHTRLDRFSMPAHSSSAKLARVSWVPREWQKLFPPPVGAAYAPVLRKNLRLPNIY